MKVRIKSTNEGNDKKGKKYNKLITSVNMSMENGYALVGDFLTIDKEYGIDVGSLILKVGFEGSHKNGKLYGTIYRVTEEGTEEELASYDYYNEFLSLRDKLDELLNDVGTEFNPEKFVSGLSEGELESLKKYLIG